jgi:hypothetical protein
VSRALLLLAVALAAGCDRDRSQAEAAVRAYDEAAIAAYRSRDLAPLGAAATERERNKVLVLVDLKSAAGLVLESELVSLELTRVGRPGPDRLEAEARERWRYFDRAVTPGAPTAGRIAADMTLAYELVREDEAWKVDAVRTLSMTYLDPATLAALPVRDAGAEHPQGATP